MTNIAVSSAGEITQLFPNPATDEINISYAAKNSGESQIVLTDLVGRELLLQNFVSSPGEMQFRMDVSGIAPGIYLLQIKTEEGLISRKIEIQ